MTIDMSRHRLRCLSLLLSASVALWMSEAVAASKYLKQFESGDYAYELVKEMEARGCTMTETEMSAYLRARGAHISDVQATILNLARAGDLVWDRKSSYTLVDWGKCS